MTIQRAVATFSIAALALASLSGCARIETGSVGIVKHFFGEISTEPAVGLKWTIFDKVHIVDITETRIPMASLRPSDANGVLLDSMDIVVSFKLNPAKVPTFYIQTKELDTYVDESGRSFTTVGLSVLRNIVQHSVQEVTKTEVITSLSANLGGYEKAILERAQAELNNGYPGVFQLVRININHFTPPTAIRDQVNAIASLKVEALRIDQEQTLIQKRTDLEAAKSVLDARALRAGMDATHLTAEQLIAWKNARAYEVQARAVGESSLKTIDLTKQPAPK